MRGFEVLRRLFLNEGTFEIVYRRVGGAGVELFEFRDQNPAIAVGVPDTVDGFDHLAQQADDVDTGRCRRDG